MSLVPPVPPSSTGEDDDNRSSNINNPTSSPPSSLHSQQITSSSSSSIPPGPVKLTARSCLYEICAQSHWNPPVFDCCNEQGASNLRSFTYKASIEMKEGSGSKLVVECIGKPKFSKKSAAESAAEGILWYLVHLGYPKKSNRSKKLR
ncbi:hypothetical protein M8C21_033081 [Ambrosia artemisiifolia]|uniref:DRBM domain-containing protein n=1 Tax=Ambrosia artemisiifolia TaxID=4212 RepID=A0AAD5CQ14_AMBAR|nr:hypothetical protein M8C21_033081 [Ambrosia artemisiifolia]